MSVGIVPVKPVRVGVVSFFNHVRCTWWQWLGRRPSAELPTGFVSKPSRVVFLPVLPSQLGEHPTTVISVGIAPASRFGGADSSGVRVGV
jgi:hypothetical protein